jgi:hypothetical protein
MLPAALYLRAEPGRHSPCLHGCVLTVESRGVVAIEGPSRDRIFDQAARFLRVVTKGAAAQSIAAVLQTPALGRSPGGRDGWSIITGARVAFSPTSLPPHIINDIQAEADRPMSLLPVVRSC